MKVHGNKKAVTKEKKILIRVNYKEFDETKKFARESGLNVSEFLRRLLSEKNKGKSAGLIYNRIRSKHAAIIKGFNSLLAAKRKKGTA